MPKREELEREVTALTSEDVAGFVEKLEDWAKRLPEKEQMLAQAVAKRLRDAEGDDVAGFIWGVFSAPTVPAAKPFRKELETTTKDLEATDRMGNYSIGR
jgi:hypothetical protein